MSLVKAESHAHTQAVVGRVGAVGGPEHSGLKTDNMY